MKHSWPASSGLFHAGSAQIRGGATRMSTGGIPPEGISAGEVGGVVAGVIALVAAIGKGLAWLLNWNEARTSNRQARLEKWEASLVERERSYREEIEARLEQAEERLQHAEDKTATMATTIANLRSNQAALTIAVVDLATDLDVHAPTSPVLLGVIRSLRKLALPEPSPALEALAARLDARLSD